MQILVENAGDLGETKESAHGTVSAAPAPDQHATCKEVDALATPQRNTSPAFQFYPKDFISSSKVQRMSLTERGIYICLLSHCWLDGSLPDDVGYLARLVGMRQPQFARLWASSPLHECFVSRQGRLTHSRLDEERRKQSEYRRRQSDNGKLGGRPSKEKAVGSSGLSETEPKKRSSSSSSSSSPSPKEKEICAEPPSDSTPVILTFPTVGPHRSWDLRQSQIDRWVEAFPNVNVEYEARKALAWVEAHMDKRKTSKGMPGFLVGWFGRAADRGGSSPGVVSHSPKTAGNVEALMRFVERGRTA